MMILALNWRKCANLTLISLLISLFLHSTTNCELTKSKKVIDTSSEFDCKNKRPFGLCNECCKKWGFLAQYENNGCTCFYYQPIEVKSAKKAEEKKEASGIVDEANSDFVEEDGLVARIMHDKNLAEHKLAWDLSSFDDQLAQSLIMNEKRNGPHILYKYTFVNTYCNDDDHYD